MPLIRVFIYISMIPIVLVFCKTAGIDERFIEGKEYLESIYENIIDS